MMPDDGSRPPVSRREFIKNLVASGALLQAVPAEVTPRRSSGPRLIDREDLVRRHSPVNRNLDPLSPLSIGNGEFAFTADITGLQTFPEEYDRAMPLCTM